MQVSPKKNNGWDESKRQLIQTDHFPRKINIERWGDDYSHDDYKFDYPDWYPG